MKGQAALELFLVFLLTLLLLFWLANFSASFRSTAEQASLVQQQRIALKSIARVANSACIYKSNLTIATPCITKGNARLYYKIEADANSNKLRIFNSFANQYENTSIACNFTGSLSLHVNCTASANLCISINTTNVTIGVGTC